MKTLLLLISLFISLQADKDCKSFYETNLPDRIYGKVIEKVEKEEFYILKIDNSIQKKEISISLIKNKTGKEVFNFANKESILKKRKGQQGLSVLTPFEGGYNGHSFPDLCN